MQRSWVAGMWARDPVEELLDGVFFSRCGNICPCFADGRCDLASCGVAEGLHVASEKPLQAAVDVLIPSRTIFEGLEKICEKGRW